MKKLTILFFILISLMITSVKAELSNFEKGKNFFKDKKYDLAKFKFEQDIVFNPKNENSYLYLAKIYNLKKNDNQEEKNLNTVILLNPKNEAAILSLTLLKIRKSNYEETKKLIQNFKNICKKLCQETSGLQNKLDTILKK
jgi:Tfp pilus assembly protein PilF